MVVTLTLTLTLRRPLVALGSMVAKCVYAGLYPIQTLCRREPRERREREREKERETKERKREKRVVKTCVRVVLNL
jgi:hypothetical protein